MGRVALILLVLMVAEANASGSFSSHGVALTADGVVIAAGTGVVGSKAMVAQGGQEYPAQVLAADDETGLILLGSGVRLNPVMLADDRALDETMNYCALADPTGQARCDRLVRKGRSGTDRLMFSRADGEAVAGMPVFSRKAKLAGLLVSGSGAEAVAVSSRAIRRLVSGIPGLAAKLVPLRSVEARDFRRLPALVAGHIVQVRHVEGPDAGNPSSAQAEQRPAKVRPLKAIKLPPSGAVGANASSFPAELEKLHAEGERHFHAGRHREAYRSYRQGAEQGYAKSQVSLGLLYEEGLGVSKDYEEAAGWYRKAAEAGDLQGYMNLGRMFELGRGVAEDPFHAAVLYSKAAERGHKPAHQALDRLFQKGR